MSVLFLDTETTGLPNFKLSSNHESQPHICQIAAILVDKDRKTRAELNFLIKPQDWIITEETSKIHGIKHETAIEYGIHPKGAFSLLWRLFASTTILVAHNISFDLFLLRIAAHRIGLQDPKELPFEKFCTMSKSKDILKLPPTEKMRAAGLKMFKSPNLQETYKHFFGVEFDGSHDAMNDVRACRDVYFKLQDM